LPARALNLAAIPLRQPFIQQVLSEAGEGVPLTPGAAAVITGLDLQGQVTQVEIDGAQAGTTEASADRIGFNLPAALAAGPHSVQVRHGLEIGTSGTPRLVFASNLGAFVLHPVITQTAGNFDIALSNTQGAGAAPRSAVIAVGVAPAVGPKQTATLELLKLQQVAYTFSAAVRTSSVTQLNFSISGVTAGVYLFRLRIDGAESPLQLDANRVPVGPKGTIP
jgi:hypothetical protein